MKDFFTITPTELENNVAQTSEKRILWRTEGKGPAMAIRENCINVVACRVAQNNLTSSMRIGIELAARAEADVEQWSGWDREGEPVVHREAPTARSPKSASDLPPVQRVLYLNTYASLENLRSTMDFYAEKLPQMQARRERMGEGATGLGGLPILYSSVPMNVMVYQCDKIRQCIEENKIDVLILNSFEKATMSAYDKKKLARLLEDWQEEFNLTVIVFTTEVRKGMRAGVSMRGPIGQLVGSAGSFWFMSDDKSEIYPYVEHSAIKDSENEFRTKHNYKTGEIRPEPTSPIYDPWERTLLLLAKGDRRTWEEEKELSPFTCAAMEGRMTEKEKQKAGVLEG